MSHSAKRAKPSEPDSLKGLSRHTLVPLKLASRQDVLDLRPDVKTDDITIQGNIAEVLVALVEGKRWFPETRRLKVKYNTVAAVLLDGLDVDMLARAVNLNAIKRLRVKKVPIEACLAILDRMTEGQCALKELDVADLPEDAPFNTSFLAHPRVINIHRLFVGKFPLSGPPVPFPNLRVMHVGEFVHPTGNPVGAGTALPPATALAEWFPRVRLLCLPSDARKRIDLSLEKMPLRTALHVNEAKTRILRATLTTLFGPDPGESREFCAVAMSMIMRPAPMNKAVTNFAIKFCTEEERSKIAREALIDGRLELNPKAVLMRRGLGFEADLPVECVVAIANRIVPNPRVSGTTYDTWYWSRLRGALILSLLRAQFGQAGVTSIPDDTVSLTRRAVSDIATGSWVALGILDELLTTCIVAAEVATCCGLAESLLSEFQFARRALAITNHLVPPVMDEDMTAFMDCVRRAVAFVVRQPNEGELDSKLELMLEACRGARLMLRGKCPKWVPCM